MSACQTLIAAAALAAMAWPACAETPADLSDLVGARGSSGETQLQARGYELIRSTRVRDQSFTFWWSDVQRQCVSISTSDGRYASVERVPDANCRSKESVTAPALVSGGPAALSLSCYGDGRHVTYESHSGFQYNEKTRKYENTERSETGTEQFKTVVEVEVAGEGGRIHFTGKMVPPINAGSKEGWFDLRDLRVTSDRITGKYRLNFASSPSVDIDRRTGMMEVKGAVNFTGRCEQGGGSGERRF